MKSLVTIVIVVVAGLIIAGQALFIVDETKFAVVTRFGEIQRVLRAPGLRVKTPFIEEVKFFDNRLLRIDVPTRSMPDREQQFLDIDAYARYRIKDPRRFLLTLRDEFIAQDRIGNIVASELRQVVAGKDRTDIIGGQSTVQPDGTIVVQPKKTEEGVETREALTQEVITGANEAIKSPENNFGVEIVDVSIKRADFPETVEQSVFNRMRTERNVQADRLRAEGAEENLKITADVDKQVTVIRAEAERTSNELRGEGEAEAIAILAEALERDPELFAFLRSLEAYEKFLPENSTVVLSSEDELFKFLESPNPATPTPTPTP